MSQIKLAHAASHHNRGLISAGVKCGCFYCCRLFDGGVITQWIDSDHATALCPHCGIDSVVPELVTRIGHSVIADVTIHLSEKFLACMHAYWFDQDIKLD